MGRYHILSQYVWPDGAPTAIYAEQLAERLRVRGAEVLHEIPIAFRWLHRTSHRGRRVRRQR